MAFIPDDRQTSAQIRVDDVLLLGNLKLNRWARTRGVRFKLRNPYEKRANERHSNPNFKGYSREFHFLNPESEEVATDNGLLGLVYDTSLPRGQQPDSSGFSLRLAYCAAVRVVGFDL